MQQLSWSLSRFETQDIKTQPRFNHYVNVYPTDVLDQEQSLLLGGYTVSLPTFPLLGFTALRQVERRMNVTARHRDV